jgi:LmbE family N-acetylglucosaminyl deacetylase
VGVVHGGVKAALLSALGVFSLTLAGCTAVVPSSTGPSVSVSPSAAPSLSSQPTTTPPPTPEVPSLNAMTYEQLVALAQACPDRVVSDPAVASVPIAGVHQWAVDAMMYFAATAQCAEIPVVLARDVAGAEPPDMVFSSPLQFIEPACAGATVVSFWAHYDDDLIFANPFLQQAIDSGQCLRTFFFTGSDAGEGEGSYAVNREAGIRAAYDAIRGAKGEWVDTVVPLKSGVTVTLSRPVGDDRVSLMFLRLPDGGLQGSGYKATGGESLPELVNGDIPLMHTIDTGQEITLDELQGTVAELVSGYRASQVLAHLPGFADGSGGDHPDHRAVGRIVAAPVDAALIDANIVQYAMGYPVDRRAANVDGDALSRKLKAFATYASHDPVIACKDPAGCLKVRRFGDWLQRQYVIPHNGLVRVN